VGESLGRDSADIPRTDVPPVREADTMLRSRTMQAAAIGALSALATFCALSARAGDTYSVVAQSGPETAGTGRRPLAERIAAANLPIIVQTAATAPAPTAAEEDPENKAIPPVAVAAASNGSGAKGSGRDRSGAAQAALPKGFRMPWTARQPVRSAARPATATPR